MTGKSIFDQERLTSEYNFYQDHLDIKIEEAYKWLNYNCQYIPRKEIGVDNYE